MVRSAPADYREYIKLAVDLPANPKLAMIDNPAAGWAYVVSLCYCGQHLTDGSFPMTPLLRLAGVKPAIAKLLIGAELWHEAGHTCDRCPQPMAGTGIVHDYLLHQRSSGEAKALRDARREAGRRGAASRWDSNGDGKSHSKSHSKGEASGMADASQTDASPMAEVEVEVEEEEEPTTTTTTPTSSEPPAKPKRRRSAADEPPREEVKALCAHLRDLVVANGSKEPNRSAKAAWLVDARRLLDIDKRALAEAHALIAWCQNDSFWKANVRCMESFRRQYDALRLRAQAELGERHLSAVQSPRTLESFADYREHAAGAEAARLINKAYLPRAQPPSDDSPPRQWAAQVAVEWIDAHEQQIRAALAERKPA